MKTEPLQIVLLLLVWNTVEYVCMYTLHNARVNPPCRPGDVGVRSPDIILHQSWDEQD